VLPQRLPLDCHRPVYEQGRPAPAMSARIPTRVPGNRLQAVRSGGARTHLHAIRPHSGLWGVVARGARAGDGLAGESTGVVVVAHAVLFPHALRFKTAFRKPLGIVRTAVLGFSREHLLLTLVGDLDWASCSRSISPTQVTESCRTQSDAASARETHAPPKPATEGRGPCPIRIDSHGLPG
jgi:hypothetical protein